MASNCRTCGRFLVFPWTIAIAALVGCGKPESERTTVFPVEGVVTFDGKPTPGAMIVLHPKGALASNVPTPRAQVEKDGSFRFTTYQSGDGVPTGDYVATIAWYKLVGKPGEFQAGPNVLPPRYSNPKTSKWEIRVADQPAQLAPVQLRR